MNIFHFELQGSKICMRMEWKTPSFFCCISVVVVVQCVRLLWNNGEGAQCGTQFIVAHPCKNERNHSQATSLITRVPPRTALVKGTGWIFLLFSETVPPQKKNTKMEKERTSLGRVPTRRQYHMQMATSLMRRTGLPDTLPRAIFHMGGIQAEPN